MNMNAAKPQFFEFTNNVVAKAEFRYQRFLIENSRSGIGWIVTAVLMLAPAILFSLLLFLIGGYSQWAAINQLLYHDNTTIRILMQIGSIAFVTMNVALYFVVMLITMGLSASSISREKNNHTWHVLVLTELNARQIVWGKWWASLQALWGDHILLAVLRLGVAGWLIVVYHEKLPAGVFGLPPGATAVIAMTVLIVAFTVIDAMFTTAMGIAIPLSDLPGSIILSIVAGVRVVATVAALIFANEIKNSMVHDEPYMLLGFFGLACFGFATYAALKLAEYIAIHGSVSAE